MPETKYENGDQTIAECQCIPYQALIRIIIAYDI